VVSDKDVIAERAMYGEGRQWGHDSVGISEPSKAWFLPEGSTGPGFETWILVQNPHQDKPARVEITYMTPEGQVEGPKETLQPGARRSFNVADSVPDTWEVSTQVVSDKDVIAERAMYGEGRQWGHDSVAGRL
jgi:hypothetical protein